MKKLVLFSFLTVISLNAQENFEKPTLEQLINSKVVKISVECFRDDENFNQEAWQEIAVAVNALIDLCYTSGSDEESNDTVFQEVHKTIDYIRNVRRVNGSQGIHGMLNVSVGEPENNNQNDQKENAQ